MHIDNALAYIKAITSTTLLRRISRAREATIGSIGGYASGGQVHSTITLSTIFQTKPYITSTSSGTLLDCHLAINDGFAK
jgi:hypothetical protein